MYDGPAVAFMRQGRSDHDPALVWCPFQKNKYNTPGNLFQTGNHCTYNVNIIKFYNKQILQRALTLQLKSGKEFWRNTTSQGMSFLMR